MTVADLKVGDTFRIRKGGLKYKVIAIQGMAEARWCTSTTQVVTRGGFRANFRNKLFLKNTEIYERT